MQPPIVLLLFSHVWGLSPRCSRSSHLHESHPAKCLECNCSLSGCQGSDLPIASSSCSHLWSYCYLAYSSEEAVQWIFPGCASRTAPREFHLLKASQVLPCQSFYKS